MTYRDRLKELGLEKDQNRVWSPRFVNTSPTVVRTERQLKYLSISWERWQPFEGKVKLIAVEDL